MKECDLPQCPIKESCEFKNNPKECQYYKDVKREHERVGFNICPECPNPTYVEEKKKCFDCIGTNDNNISEVYDDQQ